MRAVVSIRVSTAIAGTCGTAHRAHPLLICGGAVKHPRGAPATEVFIACRLIATVVLDDAPTGGWLRSRGVGDTHGAAAAACN
jgi:hypothetical protein